MFHYVDFFSFVSRKAVFETHQSALFITELGMFGNMTKRLAATMAISKSLGIRHVIVPPAAEFSGGLFRRGIQDFSDMTLWFCAENPGFHNPIRVLSKNDSLYHRQNDDLFPEDYARRIWSDLSSVLIPQAKGPALPEDHLVIHLRGGDVFGPRKPGSYGQPPLSYYELILDSGQWSGVTVVHQDQKNPVLDPLLAMCRKRQIPVSHQTGTLLEDLPTLLRASTLVAGRGTFIPAIAGLARGVKTVYFFEDKFSVFPAVPDLRIIRVRDRHGDYVEKTLSGNWANTPEQRALMLEYPMSSLVIESEDSGHSR
jgi:hypothetical protein